MPRPSAEPRLGIAHPSHKNAVRAEDDECCRGSTVDIRPGNRLMGRVKPCKQCLGLDGPLPGVVQEDHHGGLGSACSVSSMAIRDGKEIP